MKKELQEKINQLQILEVNVQNILLQKRTLQVQLLEIENALKELQTNNEETYKIISNIMIKTSKESLVRELNSKKEVIDIKLKSIERQETDIMEKAARLQQEILKESD